MSTTRLRLPHPLVLLVGFVLFVAAAKRLDEARGGRVDPVPVLLLTAVYGALVSFNYIANACYVSQAGDLGAVSVLSMNNPRSLFTKGGNAVFAVFHDGRKAPAANPATEAERAALFATMSAAISTYKVEGNTLTMTYSSSWNQSWTGTTQKRHVEFVGNKLTLMSAPFKSAQTGQDTVFVVTYERVEQG